MRWLIFILMIGLGIVLLSYSVRIVNSFGHLDWAEQRLGPGGTYTVWRITGIVLILGAFLVVRYGSSLGL